MKTQITANGLSVCAPGEERYGKFEVRKGGRFCHYDYRDGDGALFSVVLPTLERCRAARDKWLTERR